jgi:hypothetical protein
MGISSEDDWLLTLNKENNSMINHCFIECKNKLFNAEIT